MSVDKKSLNKLSINEMSEYKMFADELCGDKVRCFQCSPTQHC